ncbi:MAG: Crp/Fnr family transcriptional regulator [Acidobacteria bacterium]|nr:MAG: Crp/Fnr family transcriptional regulator [Acidobacteriota bacterium]
MAADKENQSSQRERTDIRGRSVENKILLTIPDHEYRALRPHLEFVLLEMHQVLQDPGERIEFGFFLNSGLASLMIVTSDARSVEVGMVGSEGFVGAPLAMGVRDSSQRAIIQVPADAFRVKSELLETILASAPVLQQGLNHFVLLQGLQVAQLAACNRLHEIEQRLARWLLMTHDRVGSNSFPITHDLLAQMLGSGRPSVTVAAGGLQKAGIIEYTRGVVTIRNRKGLERAACECYRAIRRITAYNGMK